MVTEPRMEGVGSLLKLEGRLGNVVGMDKTRLAVKLIDVICEGQSKILVGRIRPLILFSGSDNKSSRSNRGE